MIDLPAHPSPASAEPALVDFGALLTPALGGPTQKIDRMGSRFRLAVAMPPMKGGKVGRQWIARLLQAKAEGGRMEWPLQGFDPGLPGDAVEVDGAGQAGRSLAVRGVPEGYAFREGQPVSIVTGGRHHVHFVTAEALVGATGEVTLAIEPMLRVPPADGDAVHVAKPMIEGFIDGEELPWSLSVAEFVGLSFTITEAE